MAANGYVPVDLDVILRDYKLVVCLATTFGKDGRIMTPLGFYNICQFTNLWMEQDTIRQRAFCDPKMIALDNYRLDISISAKFEKK